MLLLAVESSCDETSVAVVRDGLLISNVVSTQIEMHAGYGGVVPEIATREHLKNLLPVAREAMTQASVVPSMLEAVAATRGPGLPAALQAGYTLGQTLAFTLGIPFLGVHHHEAHLYSPWISGDPPALDLNGIQPHLSLIVSGGHTMLVHVSGPFAHRVIGGTLDDAAGECFDKSAKLLGLPYPGGPYLDALADEGRSDFYNFPRPLLNEPNDDFSFSGLKTSVRTFLGRNPVLAEDPVGLRDVCASIRAAIVETLVGKTIKAAKRLSLKCITASGGVTCNRGLRRELAAACEREGIVLRMAARTFCTDNAAMVGLLAHARLQSGTVATEPSVGVMPGWDLGEVI